MTIRNFLVLTAMLALFVMGNLIYALESAKQLAILDGGEPQRTWPDAVAYCQAQSMHLPNIWQMLGIYYTRKITLIDATDYWSSTQLLNRSFGVATRFGILSYDVQHDDDHFVCVK